MFFHIAFKERMHAFAHIRTGMNKILIKSWSSPAWSANNLLQPVSKVAKYTVLSKALNPQQLGLLSTLLNANYFGKKASNIVFVKRKDDEHLISLR